MKLRSFNVMQMNCIGVIISLEQGDLCKVWHSLASKPKAAIFSREQISVACKSGRMSCRTQNNNPNDPHRPCTSHASVCLHLQYKIQLLLFTTYIQDQLFFSTELNIHAANYYISHARNDLRLNFFQEIWGKRPCDPDILTTIFFPMPVTAP